MNFLVDAQLPRQMADVIITKDSDFVDSHILNDRPAKLLLI